jgi:Domain of unknown function (DUF4136)
MDRKIVDRERRRQVAVRWWLPTMAAVAVLLTACASVRVSSDYDHGAGFSQYHAYAWLPRTHTRSQNPLAVRHAQEAIDAEMHKKGYTLVSDLDGADIVVDFTLSAKERVDVQSYPVAYRGPWLWGRRYYGDQIDVRTYREGSLTIDIFDGRTHQSVWTGKATKELSRAELEHSRAPVQAATTAVLATFPPL